MPNIAPVGTRDITNLSDRLSEAVQMLRCLRPHCVDLQSESGVDVGVFLGAVEALVAQQYEQLCRLMSHQVSQDRELFDGPTVRAVGAQNHPTDH